MVHRILRLIDRTVEDQTMTATIDDIAIATATVIVIVTAMREIVVRPTRTTVATRNPAIRLAPIPTCHRIRRHHRRRRHAHPSRRTKQLLQV